MRAEACGWQALISSVGQGWLASGWAQISCGTQRLREEGEVGVEWSEARQLVVAVVMSQTTTVFPCSADTTR